MAASVAVALVTLYTAAASVVAAAPEVAHMILAAELLLPCFSRLLLPCLQLRWRPHPQQCCGSGMFILDPTFFRPGSA
jgi:hypothetical protein